LLGFTAIANGFQQPRRLDRFVQVAGNAKQGGLLRGAVRVYVEQLESRQAVRQTVTVGGEFNAATSVTKITSTANIVVFEARNSSDPGGVGVRAHSNNGTAIQASSSNLTPAVRPDTTIYGFHNGTQLVASDTKVGWVQLEVPV
jgi:hypothetical protein